jgi:hypothetical protein
MFRFGVERGRILIILIAILPAAVFGPCRRSGRTALRRLSGNGHIRRACVLRALLFPLLRISMHIYRKKESPDRKRKIKRGARSKPGAGGTVKKV